MKKVIVTGGCGFIGSHVVKKLVQSNIDVLIIDNLSTGNTDYINESYEISKKNNSKVELYEIDINDNNLKIQESYDAIFHLAALPRVEPSIKKPFPYHIINVDGTLKMLELCRTNKIKKFVFSSSSSIYGNPKTLPTKENNKISCMSPYALHKQIGEEYCKLYSELYNISCTALRYFNVYGENQPSEGAYVPVIGIWFKQFCENTHLTITGDGTQTRDFVYAGDVANANYLAAIKNNKKFMCYNVGSEKNYSLNELANIISKNIKYIEKRYEPHTTLADCSKIKKELLWKPKVDLLNWIKLQGYGS